ncbi:uncharacterized protein LOC129262537 isoform X2 [Lytechinus pictus]
MDLKGGCVTAKSPLLKIHSNTLFLTEIQTGSGPDSKLFLLARGDDASKFYNDIHVTSFYDIDNVTQTTITKGTDRPRKILLLSASSKIIPYRKDEITMETDISTLEGTITRCIDQTLGIYELSSNARLYLTYQYDGKSHLPSIPIGSKVTIHNAHILCASARSSEPVCDGENILCCMRTSIQIEEKSKEKLKKEKSTNVQRVLLPLCGKLFPSLHILEWLRDRAIPILLQKLVPHVIKLKEVLPVLIQILTIKLTSNDLPIIKERKRNPYEDFLSHDASCLFSYTSNDIPKTVSCTLPTSSELVSSFDGCPLGDITSLDQSGWTCRMITSSDGLVPMVLVAKLCCERTDGRLFLLDATGSIPCTLISSLPMREGSGKKPDKSCNKRDETNHKSTTCCFPQPCLNHLLRIEDFIVIQEKRTCVDSSRIKVDQNESEMDVDGGDSIDRSRSEVKVYVMFDPRYAVCLYRGTEKKSSPSGVKPRMRKRSSSKSDGSLPECITSKTIQLRSRRPLIHQEQRDSGSTTPRFYCDILILDSYQAKKTKRDKTLLIQGSDGEMEEKQEEDRRPALLCFQDDAIRWYHFLRDGQIYKMECRDDDMQTHVVPSIMKLAKKGRTQPVYIITSFSQLQVLQHTTSQIDCKAEDENDSGQMSKGKQRQCHMLSSVSGHITRVTSLEGHSSNEKATCQDSFIHLKIDDIISRTTATVSLPAHLHDDILGLVPGATVTIRNCLKKVDPGFAVTYDIGPLTSIQVDSFCFNSFKEIASSTDAHHSSHQSLPATRQRSFLYHMIHDTNKDSTRISWLYAHITLITKLVIRWLCNHCGRNDCKCPDSARQAGKIITQIVLAVDDGTGECLIWSNRPNVVAMALDLNSRDWAILEDSCTGPNKELVYHKAKEQKQEYDWEAASGSRRRQSRLIEALSYLCQHHSIQRSLWFNTRRFRESTKDLPSKSEKTAWPAGLVLCCEDVSS